MSRKKKLEKILEELEIGIQELFQSEEYLDYLDTMSKFHHYSFNNSVLIHRQNPNATLVAGYQTWIRDFHRYVRKGEKAIRILAPFTFEVEDEKTKETVKKTGFKPAYVFDISQTDGEPLPSMIKDQLDQEVQDYEQFLKAITLVSKIPVRFCDINGSANGYYHPIEEVIVIQEGMNELKTLKTLLHEVAHSRMHRDIELDKATCELEAESVAYSVLKHYGLNTEEYSFGYIGLWSKDKELSFLKSSMNRIVDCANSLIEEIDVVRQIPTDHNAVFMSAKKHRAMQEEIFLEI